MLGGVVSRGKTVDEAVFKAAKQLKVQVEDLDYEVVNSGYSNFLFTRPAVIQARIRQKKGLSVAINKNDLLGKEKILSNIEMEKSIAEVDGGTAWVKNGKVFCKDGEYQYAIINPCEGITMTLNGQVVTGSTILTEDDEIEIELNKEIVESEFTLTVSEDKLQVLLQIMPGYAVIRQLDDLAPSRELTITVTETKIMKTDLKEFQILNELKQLGVRFGIQYDEIQSACQTLQPITIVAAKGIEPIPGIDGSFELLHKIRNQQKDQFTLSENIDWKERFSLPMAHAGDVIGQPIPPKPGIPGKNVYGEVIAAPEVKQITIVTAEGTTLHGAEQKVVAISSGRIKVDRRSNNTLCFSILPQYVHHGDVNLQTGNIRFHGDVYIIGNVEEGMSVTAGGNLHITGQISNAIVRTGGDAIITGSIVGSSIICGYSNLVWDKMLPTFKTIREELKLLIGAVKQLSLNRSFSKSDLSKIGIQPLLRLLTENKFKELPSRIREISTVIKDEKDKFDSDTIHVMDFLEKAFLTHHPSVTSLEQLESLLIYMENQISAVEFDSNKKMNIQVKSLTNSSIMSAWDVMIDRFSYGSDIYCKGGIKVKETIRGGTIQSGDYVIAAEIGSVGGTNTKVQVKKSDGYIKAESIWADTIVRVGEVVKKLLTQEEQLYVKLNERNQLILR